MLKQINRVNEINVFDLRQTHKKYWRQCEIKKDSVIGDSATWKYTDDDGETVLCRIFDYFDTPYDQCTDYWTMTSGTLIEKQCTWYQKFVEQYPTLNTNLHYHEFRQSIKPHQINKLGCGKAQCMLHYVALGSDISYTQSNEHKIMHEPGTLFLVDGEQKMVTSDINIFLTVSISQPFGDTVNIIKNA